MSFVGELIMSLRESAPDLPIQVYPAPPIFPGVSSELYPTANVQPGTYYFQYTLVFPWGESLPSPEDTYTVPAGNNAVNFAFGGAQPGMLGFKLYAGTQPGAENVSTFFPYIPPISYPTPIFATSWLGYPLQFGTPPARNTAYVPDTDGRMVNAARVFGWLNDGLGLAGQITGGLPNFSGVPSVIGQPWYTITGNWRKLDGAWYNGYPVFFGRRTDVFRKNTVTGISAALCVDMYTDRVIIEMWPQPSAMAFNSTLSAPIGPMDSTANLTPVPSSFQTSFGFVRIGPTPSGRPGVVEIVSCQSSNLNQLTGMVRGWGGTRPGMWPAGTPVTELNACISGLIIPSTYNAGDSGIDLALPPGWASGLHKYMLSRFREAERRRQEAKSLMDEFTATMQNLRTTRQYAGPIQIQASTGRGSEVYPGLGGPFGGVIVP